MILLAFLPMKRLLIIAGIVVGVLVLAVALVPLFINVDSFRPELEKKASEALNRPVQIGKLEASIWSGGASAENISIADDPAFSKGAFLQASSLKVGLQLIPLILSRQIKVTSIRAEAGDRFVAKPSREVELLEHRRNLSPTVRNAACSHAQPGTKWRLDAGVHG